ncbi:hypothetical protein V6N12_037059 [Hibiscus sabdariffa]|uniref:Uncharacterized protein n=1 Tax=Hibiscus sabdariffa TaxID=183260 RepID=A0ABR2AZD1_9ROSI
MRANSSWAKASKKKCFHMAFSSYNKGLRGLEKQTKNDVESNGHSSGNAIVFNIVHDWLNHFPFANHLSFLAFKMNPENLLFTRPDFIALRSAFTIKTWTFLELNSDEIQLSSAAPEDISAVIGIALTISKLSHICEKEILRVQYCLD